MTNLLPSPSGPIKAHAAGQSGAEHPPLFGLDSSFACSAAWHIFTQILFLSLDGDAVQH